MGLHLVILVSLFISDSLRSSLELNLSARAGQGLLRVRSGSVTADNRQSVPGPGGKPGSGETGTPGVLTASISELLRSIEYPAVARQMEIQGRVVVRVSIGADGSVQSTRIAHSSGYEVLDRAAVRGITTWRFPKTASGADLEVPVRFTLEDR